MKNPGHPARILSGSWGIRMPTLQSALRLALQRRGPQPSAQVYFSINFHNLSGERFFNFFSKINASPLVFFLITHFISHGK